MDQVGVGVDHHLPHIQPLDIQFLLVDRLLEGEEGLGDGVDNVEVCAVELQLARLNPGEV